MKRGVSLLLLTLLLGDYRLVLRWSADAGQAGLASAPFRVQSGVFAPAEA